MNLIKKYNSQIFITLISLIFFTLPLKNSYNSITIILFVIYSIYTLMESRETKFKFNKICYVFILPFLFILIQFFYSDFYVFQKNVIRSIPVLIFPIILCSFKTVFEKYKIRILNSFILIAVFYSLFLLFIAFYRQISYSPDFSKINWYFFVYHDFTDVLKLHPTYLGMYNCLAFSIAFIYILREKRYKKLYLFSLMILSVVIILSGSRISLVSLIIVSLYIFFYNFSIINRKIKWLFLIFFIFIPTLVFTFVPIVKERMIDMTFGLKETFLYAKYGDNVKYNGSLGPRFEIWKCAIENTNNNVFFGNGFGNTQKLLNQCYEKKGLKSYAELNYQTHNQFINNYARGGIVGLIILLLAFLLPLYISIKNKNIVYTCFLIIMMISSLTENVLNLHMGVVFYALFNSLLFFIPNNYLN